MTRYLTLAELLAAAHRATGQNVDVRDPGLLDSALYRPQASAFGADAYPDVWTKAAALMQSLATNHALVDGNKRTALAATYAFLAVNGHQLALSNRDAVDLVLDVATGKLDDVDDIAARLRES